MSSADQQRDLAHAVRLAVLQVESRIQKTRDAAVDPDEVLRLQMLLELLKEQIPNENACRSAGSAR